MTTKIIDADSHILEPPDLWLQYLEPELQERAMRIKTDSQGLEYLEVDGKPASGVRGGMLANIAGAGRTDLEHFLTPGAVPYEEARADAPASGDPDERVKWLDSEGSDKTLLYPSLGLDWPQDCRDPILSAAYTRAYNNWLIDFCSGHPDRLLPVAHVSLLDVEEGVKELVRTEAKGMKGAYPPVVPFNGIPYGEPHYDRFWGTAEDLGVPISLHVTGNVHGVGGDLYPRAYTAPFWWFLVTDMGDVLIAFTSLFQGGLFERFPELKIAVVETGSGWLPYWLDRMDGFYDKIGFTTPLKMRPSEYFKRQCWIVVDPDERTAAYTINFVGADRFMWGSDYPHTEGEAGALDELMENIASLPEDTQARVLGENAAELYGLN